MLGACGIYVTPMLVDESDMNAVSPSRRRRGRPAAGKKEIRNEILEAARQVYGRHGVYGATVLLILEEAGVSRPTFYKYFSSVLDVIDEIVRACNAEAESLFVKVFEQPQKDFYDYLPIALSGYLNWGRSLGPLMEARFRELHDRSSPVSKYRDEHNRRIMETVRQAAVAHGHQEPEQLALTALVQGIEHLGYQFCVMADHTEMQAYLKVMGRLCISMLGDRGDWQRMLESPYYSRLLGLDA